jgi:hypothetical protein
MNALKSFANPVPVRALVVHYFTRFTTAKLQTAKKKQEIKMELKISYAIGYKCGLLL